MSRISNRFTPQQSVAQLSPQPLARSVRLALLSLAAVGTVLITIGYSTPAAAQASQAATRAYNIPAGSLEGALASFARTSGVLLIYPPAMTEGLHSPGLRGVHTFNDGVARLLSNTDLAIVDNGGGNYTLRKQPPTSSGVLPAINVSSAPATAENNDSFVAHRTRAGKTDTSLLETPQVVNVVTRRQMDDQGIRTVAEALRYTPGVMAEPNGFDMRYDWNYIRGYNTYGTQWLDNMALPGEPSGYAAPSIPAYALERIEVIKGPASVLYGKSVPGGLLNQVTKKPREETRREVRVSTTQFGGAEVGADLTGKLTEDSQWLYRLVALERQANTQIDHERDRRTLVAPSLTWRPSAATNLTLQAHYQRDTPTMAPRFYPTVGSLQSSPVIGKIPTSLYMGEPTQDEFNRTFESVGYSFEHHFSDTFTVRQNLRWARSQQDMFLVRVHPFNPYAADGHTLNRLAAVSDDDIRTFTVDTHAEWRLRSGDVSHTVLAGVDYLHSDLSLKFGTGAAPSLDIWNPVYGQSVTRPAAYSTSTRQNVAQIGLYLQDQIRWGRTIATIGLRHDRSTVDSTNRLAGSTVNTDDSATTGRVGITYLFDNGIAPYAAYSTSYLPTLGTNRATQPFNPQKGRQVEAGVKYEPTGGWGFVSASLFRNDLKNGLTPDPANTGSQTFNVQTGEQRVQGVELEAKADLTRQVSMLAAYSYNDSEVVSSNNAVSVGREMLRTPKHQASAWLDYRFTSLPGLRAGVGGRYLSDYQTDSTYLSALRIPSLFLWDLGASYDFSQVGMRGWKLQLAVANVADKVYVSHCINTGANCNYGARRTATATLSYQW